MGSSSSATFDWQAELGAVERRIDDLEQKLILHRRVLEERAASNKNTATTERLIQVFEDSLRHAREFRQFAESRISAQKTHPDVSGNIALGQPTEGKTSYSSAAEPSARTVRIKSIAIEVAREPPAGSEDFVDRPTQLNEQSRGVRIESITIKRS